MGLHSAGPDGGEAGLMTAFFSESSVAPIERNGNHSSSLVDEHTRDRLRSGEAAEEAYAALALQPEWHFVRDILIPQIEQRRKQTNE